MPRDVLHAVAGRDRPVDHLVAAGEVWLAGDCHHAALLVAGAPDSLNIFKQARLPYLFPVSVTRNRPGSNNTFGNDKELNTEVQRHPVHPRVGGCLR